MKKIEINGKKYQLMENKNDCFNEEALLLKLTEYFDPYDYILGDYSYEKLRLKGFYDTTSKSATSINNITQWKEYIKKYCAYGCNYFLLKKEK